MPRRLYLVAGKVTDSVTDGFLPAALRLGLTVTVLTDRVSAHEAAYAYADEVEIMECDVRDFRAIVSAVTAHHPAVAIFSNSDHLQTQTALAAAYFDLPAKDWRAALHTKNKAMMRARLRRIGRENVAGAVLEPGDDPDAAAALATSIGAGYPLVVKPCEGVASEDVMLVGGPAELAARCAEIRRRRPGEALLVEEYLPGELHTLETLGDGRATAVLGSFRTTLSDPPHFIERRLEWSPYAVAPGEADGVTARVLGHLRALGVGFGACHTEFVVDAGKARLVEVNYRIIGDHCDFLLADLLGVPIFEYVLRVHLGEPLDRAAVAPARHRHALVDSVIAERPGVLAAAPGPLELRTADGVRLAYRPLRTVGDRIARTNTNRDYLGMIRVIGPDRQRVEAATDRFRAAHRWEIVS